jgi:SPW repeat-containing protein
MVERQSKFEVLVDVLNLVLGTFLVLTPWTFGVIAGVPRHGDIAPGVLNAWVAGTAIDLMAAAAIVAFAEWQEWTSFFIGLWTAGAPWFLGFGGSPHARWVHVSVGIAVATLAGVELLLLDRRSPPRSDRTLKVIDSAGNSPATAEVVIARERRPAIKHDQSVVIPFVSRRTRSATASGPSRSPTAGDGRPIFDA